jgi:DNA (cytosine-5)-methyltransferase 1
MKLTKPKKILTESTIKVAELFAGVGGFREGLETSNPESFKVVLSNQHEPGEKTQFASKIYVERYGPEGHFNIPIEDLLDSGIHEQDEYKEIDLVVGGFPCQDYSVAKARGKASGIEGKKGVLWWSILRLIESNKPKYVLLENVDRLAKSPSSQPGRDFAVMLRSLNNAGYTVEWRVINAGEFGFPQRRKRIYILAEYRGAEPANYDRYLSEESVISRAFPMSALGAMADLELADDLIDISENFNLGGKKSPFQTAGFAINGFVKTIALSPKSIQTLPLKEVILPAEEVASEFWISNVDVQRWKDAKKGVRKDRMKGDFSYIYSEGDMPFPDSIDKPSRTIVTGEGGKTPSRFKHVIMQGRRYRRLTIEELEILNGFKAGWTTSEALKISDSRRAFLMGNALVVGVIEKIGESLAKHHAAQ